MVSAPTGRANKAQANGLGQEFRPLSDSRALKGRYKDRQPGFGDRPPASQNVVSPFQGLRAKGKAFSDPGRWPGLR
jgi:hypothetical protein